MNRKRGKMGQPVKNGTRYKKCTLGSTVEPRFSDHRFSDKLRFSDTFFDDQFFIK